MPVKIFFCYAHEDKKMLVQLQKHLKPLQQHGHIETWHDQDISAGSEWEPAIAKRLHEAQIILLLISADFINSEYCYNKEMKWALERHQRGEARVIPIILRDVLWRYGPFSNLQALPSEAKPVYRWTHRDEAYMDITEGIARIIEELSLPSLVKSAIQSPQATSPQQKRALLILTGGTVLPDILLLLHYRPQLICVVSPHDWPFQRTYTDIVQGIPLCEIKILPSVNPYNIDECLQACLDSYLPYTHEKLEWIMALASATKVMALAGYEFARQNKIRPWLVDPVQEHIVALETQISVDTRKFFHPTVSEYVDNYGYAVADFGSSAKAHREKAETWSSIISEIIHSPEALLWLSLLIDKSKKESMVIPAKLRATSPFSSLITTEALKIIQEHDDGTVTCCFPSTDCAHFFGLGEWLTLYVRHEVCHAKIADDCLWNCELVHDQERFELDLVLTQRARLLLVECKVGWSFPGVESLLALEAMANRLGRSYVSRLFITSRANVPEQDRLFYEHAQLRNVVVATWEDLPNIGCIIQRTLRAPTYIRA